MSNDFVQPSSPPCGVALPRLVHSLDWASCCWLFAAGSVTAALRNGSCTLASTTLLLLFSCGCRGFPNKEFWSNLNDLVFEGIVFTFHGCRKPAKLAAAGSKYATIGSSTGAGAAEEPAAPAFSGSSDAAGGGSGYQGNSSAYTNL